MVFIKTSGRKEEEKERKNYRPIRQKFVRSKVFDRIILDFCLSYFLKNKLFENKLFNNC